MLIRGINNLNFTSRHQTSIDKISPEIKSQLPAKGSCIVSAYDVVDEEPEDYLEITQDDGATKFITKFVGDKKISQEEIYNGKSAGINKFA